MDNEKSSFMGQVWFLAPSCPLGLLKSQKNFLFFFFHHFTSIPPLRNPAGWLRNHFFHLLRPLVELENFFFFKNFSHLALFGSKNFFYPKYGLLGLKSLGFARAFTSRNKIASFFTGNTFFLFFWHYWHKWNYSSTWNYRILNFWIWWNDYLWVRKYARTVHLESIQDYN